MYAWLPLKDDSVRPVQVKKETTALSVHQYAFMRMLLPATQLLQLLLPICKKADRLCCCLTQDCHMVHGLCTLYTVRWQRPY